MCERCGYPDHFEAGPQRCLRCGLPLEAGDHSLTHGLLESCVRMLMDRNISLEEQVKDLEREMEQHSTDRVNQRKEVTVMKAALRKIAFWLPTVCYEHDDRRYTDIEDVYTIKNIAADARIGRKATQ